MDQAAGAQEQCGKRCPKGDRKAHGTFISSLPEHLGRQSGLDLMTDHSGPGSPEELWRWQLAYLPEAYPARHCSPSNG